jgi:hypothetical protein
MDTDKLELAMNNFKDQDQAGTQWRDHKSSLTLSSPRQHPSNFENALLDIVSS